MSFDFLYHPVESLDESLTSLFENAPILVSLGLAFLLGLRHASDPDHLVAVTSLVAGDKSDSRAAARLGAWWGAGHAATLLAIGIPLIIFKTELPAWLENAAERAVGVVIVILAARVLWKWRQGEYKASAHAHRPRRTAIATSTKRTCTTTTGSERPGRRSPSVCSMDSPEPGR